jgi:hypothetical protein
MTIGKYNINVSKETMWGAGLLLAVGVVVFVYNRNKKAALPAQEAASISTAANYSTAYRHAVELQMQELAEKGITKINLADPTSWPAYK